MKQKHYLPIAVLVGIVLFTSGFFVGKMSASSAKNSITSNTTGQGRGGAFAGANGGARGGRTGGAGFGGGVNGAILSMDSSTLTVKSSGQGSGSKVVLYSASTPIRKTVDGTLQDLKVGETIMIRGDQNTDGSVTAKSIQLMNSSTFGN